MHALVMSVHCIYKCQAIQILCQPEVDRLKIISKNTHYSAKCDAQVKIPTNAWQVPYN